MPQNKLIEPIKTNKPSNPPDMDFRNQDGSYDWKAMTMYYKGVASYSPTKTNKPKGNYGKLDLPTFIEDSELPNCAYYEWKQLFLEFMKNNYMEDWEGVSFLKSKSLPQHLQQAISNLSDTSTIFSLLDTQYGDKSIEIAKIKRQIIGDTPLLDQLDLNQRLTRVKVILKYLTIFRQHFYYTEKLRINEVS